MSKTILQDIVKKGSKQPERIREKVVPKEIELTKIEPQIKPAKEKEAEIFLSKKRDFVPDEWRGESKREGNKKILKWFLVLGLLAVLFFSFIKVVSVFSSSVVKIHPKQKILPITLSLTATEQETTDGLNFQITELSHELVKQITAIDKKELNQKSSGTVVIFNNSSKDQFLLKETRLQSSDGKIYKTENALTAPANGSVETVVFADQPGKEYDLGLSDFKIPGFKGGPKYETIVGRSKTEIRGGFVGTSSVLGEETVKDGKDKLQKEIADYLTKSLIQQKPDEFILYPESVKIEFSSDESSPRAGDVGDVFTLKEKGVAKGFLIQKENLTKKLVEKYKEQGKFEQSSIRIENIDKLSFTLTSISDDGKTLTFDLSGKANFVWNTNNDEITSGLASAKNKDYTGALKKIISIEKAEIIFSPPWWKIISSNPQKIKIEEVPINEN